MASSDSLNHSNSPLRPPHVVGAPTLLVAGPALDLAQQWSAELVVLRRRSPSSDAVETLATCLHELMEAIKAAKDVRLHLTIAEVHATSRIPASTLRWLCKHKPDLLGAQKHEGVWYISRVKFERYVAMSDQEVPTERATEALRPGNEKEAA